MTAKQEARLHRSMRHWKRRALLMDRIGDRARNIEYTARLEAIERKLGIIPPPRCTNNQF